MIKNMGRSIEIHEYVDEILHWISHATMTTDRVSLQILINDLLIFVGPSLRDVQLEHRLSDMDMTATTKLIDTSIRAESSWKYSVPLR